MVIGHQKQLEFLKKTAAADKMSHAYLFCGPSRIGKKAAAMEWISHIFKETVVEGKAHPDFVFTAPDAETNNLKIESVRDLIWRLSFKPVSAPIKAAVIDGAHLMTADSQNCLLKTLEEPSKGSLLILIADNPRLLLPTITSRCETVKFGFVPQKAIMDYIKNVVLPAQSEQAPLGAAAMDEIARLSFGRPGRAIEFILNPDELKVWRDGLKELARVAASDLPERFKYVKSIAETKNLSDILEMWQFYFREQMIAALNKPAGEPADPAKTAPEKFQFTRQKNGPSQLDKTRRILREIYETNHQIATTNASAKLALENLMLEI